ncbi:MAG: hypothetical protein RL529_235 [Actinomycetota bacterium]
MNLACAFETLVVTSDFGVALGVGLGVDFGAGLGVTFGIVLTVGFGVTFGIVLGADRVTGAGLAGAGLAGAGLAGAGLAGGAGFAFAFVTAVALAQTVMAVSSA